MAKLSAAGNEADPEIADPADDIEFHPAFPNAQSHSYLDLIAVWWEYDEGTDSIRLTAKGSDFGAFANEAEDGVFVRCAFTSELRTDDEPRGRLRFWFYTPEPGGPFSSEVSIQDGGASDEIVMLPHIARVTATVPGYLTFDVSRPAVETFGSQLTGMFAGCTEQYFPAGQWPATTPLGSIPNPVANRDETEGSLRNFTLTAARPGPGGDARDDLERTLDEESVQPSGTGRPANTPGVPFLIAVAAALFISRRLARSRTKG